jgi:DNA-binding MarR family transcriptional regulator
MSAASRQPAANRMQTYPLARRVLAADIEGRKRKRVLAVIAAYLDEGHAPSVREIAVRSKLRRGTRDVPTLMALLRRLEEDGLLRVERSTPPARNRYEVLIDQLADGRAERRP